jgi:putative FmdB family regulatory protein
MPLYEYQCDACGHRFEQIRKFSDPPLEACPKCGGVVRKLISSPAFQFKGSGWYATDYGGKSKETGASRETVKKDDTGKSESAKDSKDSKDSKPSTDSSGSKDSGGESKESKGSSDSTTKSESSSSASETKAKPNP